MFEFITPPEIENIPEAQAEFDKAMQSAKEHYDKIAEILTQAHYQTMVSQGKDEKTAKRDASKKAIEDARFVLPNACETKIVVTMNARTLMSFFRHRCCNRAQWEIRAVADEMLRLCKQVAPNLFKYAGPACVHSACPEGKKSCGIAKQMREKYNG